MPAESDYPEHEKLQAVVDQSQTVGEFLDWLRSAEEDGGKGVRLLVWREWEEDDCCSHCGFSDQRTAFGRRKRAECTLCKGRGVAARPREGWVPLGIGTEKLLAEFFGIDLARIEDEKRAMLAALRAG